MTHRSILHSAAAAITLGMAAVCPVYAGGLTLGHPYFERSAVDIWARELSACIEKVTGIYVEVIGGRKLGPPRDLANAVADGLIDMAVLPVGALDKRWPELAGLDQPGQVYDPRDMMKLSESGTFIENLNDMGGRNYNLELVAIGWQHAILAGVGTGLQDLQGKKLGVRNTTLMEALQRVGANPVSIPANEILPALQYGAVDGAIVDAEMARRGVERGEFKELQWSPDFAPFASPVVVLINRTTAEAFGGRIPSRIRTECPYVTREFNARGIEDIASLAKDAKVFDVSEAERKLWRNAFDEVRASHVGPHDRLGDAVREALR